MRNMQLAMWSILLGLVPVFLNDFDSIRQNGFFQGYDKIVVGVIVCQVTGLVALVMKQGYHPQGICNISSGRLGHRPVNLYLERRSGGFVIRNSHGHDSSCSLLKYPPAEGNQHISEIKWMSTNKWLSLLLIIASVVGNIVNSVDSLCIQARPMMQIIWRSWNIESRSCKYLDNKAHHKVMLRDLYTRE
jgi:hypothetical protein